MTMKGKKKSNLHIVLPPAVALGGVESGSGASSPGPHTPLPLDYVMASSTSKKDKDGLPLDAAFDPTTLAKTGKRNREALWDDHELEILETCLLHPPCDSMHFPPGTMPPGTILDEMTNFVLTAFESRKAKNTEEEKEEGGSDDQDSNPRRSWRHSWDSTRKMLSDLALKESRLGAEIVERKMTRQEKLNRPGIRRVNSMDFLDEGDKEEKPSERIGRVLRLSTSLQNTAKQDPLIIMSRSSSTNGVSAGALPCTITVSPSSPSHNKKAPSLCRSGSFRSSRPSRPSLLQRGRSFTASDLQVEACSPPIPMVSLTDNPINLVTSPSEPIITAPPLLVDVRAPSATTFAPRVVRSKSSSAITGPPAHITRDTFLARSMPSTTDSSILAIPFSPALSPESVPSARSSDWDSDMSDLEGDDRAAKKSRTKIGQAATTTTRQRPNLIKIDQSVQQSGSLRSPFEEKLEITF